MAGKNTAVFGIYKSVAQAERAVDILSAKGFSQNDISVLLPDNESTKEFAHEKNTKAPEGTATGVTTGGVIGGTLGLLAGIGVLAIPGLGPFIAAGPIMGGLAGLGVGGAVGGLIGALVGMGIPEYEAKRYEGRLKEGGVLLSVHCDRSDEISRAKHLLTETGAEDIASSGAIVGTASAEGGLTFRSMVIHCEDCARLWQAYTEAAAHARLNKDLKAATLRHDDEAVAFYILEVKLSLLARNSASVAIEQHDLKVHGTGKARGATAR